MRADTSTRALAEHVTTAQRARRDLCVLAAAVALSSVAVPSRGPEAPRDDPLHLRIELEVDPAGVELEHVVDHQGSLHVWAVSDAVDPALRVRLLGSDVVADDEDSGGGKVPWVCFAVEPGSRLSVRVSSQDEGSGPVVLHLAAAVETAETRAAASSAKDELRAIGAAQARGALDEARALVAAAIQRVLAAEGVERSQVAASVLNHLATAAYRLDSPEDAARAFGSMHETYRLMLPPDHEHLLAAKSNQALALKRSGAVEAALELQRELLAAHERLLPPGHRTILAARQNLTATLFQLHDYEACHQHFEALLAAYERELPSDDPAVLSAKLNFAAALRQLGDLERSRRLLEEVIEVRERTLPPGHPDLLRVRQNLAILRRDRGDLPGALELLESVLSGFRELLPDDHLDLLRIETSLAITRRELGDVEGALELQEHVCAVLREKLPATRWQLLSAESNLAGTRLLLGDREGARALYEPLYEEWSRRLPADHPYLPALRQNLAVTLRAQGDLEAARALYGAALDSLERTLAPDHRMRLGVARDLAVTLMAQGERAEALEVTTSLLEGLLVFADRAHLEPPRSAREVAASEIDVLPVVLHLSSELSASETPGAEDLERRTFEALESLRAVSQTAADVTRAAAGVPELDALRRELVSVRARLGGLALAAPTEEASVDGWRRELLELSEARDGLERDLRSRLTERGLELGHPTVERVAAGLAEGAALACTLRYPRFQELELVPGEGVRSTDSLLAFVVTPDARVRRVELGPAAPVEEALLAWREACGRPVRSRGVGLSVADGDEERARAAGVALRRLLLDPILARLPEVRTLHVVPDDLLHLVPLDGLPRGDDVVGASLVVRNETSVLRLTRPRPAASAAGTLLAVGGVDYDAEAAVVEASGAPSVATPPVAGVGGDEGTRAGTLAAGFAALPETADELDAVGRAYRARFETEPVVLHGAQATKARLHAEAPGARYLHVATHGWFAPETVTSTVDAARRGAELAPDLERAERTVRGWAPETLCGLALAGANRGVDPLGRVPGILTAEELATLDLARCELAVLSACETNVGLRRAGQGIHSLESALHDAGARTTITSLWRVEDEATRELFEHFYEGLWQEGLGKAAALWRAKLALRDAGRPTRDWAGWVLTGDPD